MSGACLPISAGSSVAVLVPPQAQVIAENREEIVRVFQSWRFANRSLRADVHEIGAPAAFSCTLSKRRLLMD